MIRREIHKLLLLFYLTASFIGAVHIHSEDVGYYDDCQVSILHHNLITSDSTFTPISLSHIYHDSFIPDTACISYKTPTNTTYCAQAPPLLFS